MQSPPSRVSSLNTTGVGFVKTMTDVERHAELVYAESLFEKVRLSTWVLAAVPCHLFHVPLKGCQRCKLPGAIGSYASILAAGGPFRSRVYYQLYSG
jgi:hypothetical protein